MKHILLVITIAILSTLGLQAQIQVDYIDLNIGDVVYTKTDTSTSFDLQSPGANLSWDISNLSSPIMDSLSPINPENTAHASSFPESNMALGNDSLTVYMSSTEDAFVNLGISGSIMGYNILVKLQQADTVIKFPINYGDVRESFSWGETDTFEVETPLGNQDIKVTHSTQRSLECDAWGTMTTPIGTYDVLRVREKIITIDSVFVIPIFSWLNPVFMADYSPFDTTYKYSFYTNDATIKRPLAEVIFNPENNMALTTT